MPMQHLMSKSGPHALKTGKIKVDKRGGFILPPEFRTALRIQAGDEIVMAWKDDEIVITKARKRKSRKRLRNGR